MGTKSTTRFALALFLALRAGAALADSALLADVLAPGDVGFGATMRFEHSPYRGGESSADTLPQPVFDSRYVQLRSDRLALKLGPTSWGAQLFVQRRYDGFALDRVPSSMAGMEQRKRSADLGLHWHRQFGLSSVQIEAMQDVGDVSHGSELRFTYRYTGWWGGRLGLRPFATAAYRDARLNNYYFGVKPEEATAERPAYEPGAGVDFEVGLHAAYRLTERWQVLGGVGVSLPSSAVRASPVAEDGARPSVTLGLMYGFDRQPASEQRKPVIVRIYHGESTECGFLRIVALNCTATHQVDNTNVTAIEFGQRLVERVNGWPVDFAGFIGLLRHDQHGVEPDVWQVQGYLKVYYYGFPWRHLVRTRLGFGAGASYASRVPLNEARDQAERGRDTSKLLFYMDPTFDLNLGDISGARSLGDTYIGVGVSHRSGIFGWSDAFNNVDGGSNYIYGFVETSF